MTTDKDNVETDEKQFLMKIGKEYYYLFFFLRKQYYCIYDL